MSNPDSSSSFGIIIVITKACLRLVQVASAAERSKSGERYELLNHDDHHYILRKMDIPMSDARPDILHQCLMTLLDSPLNKIGRLQIYVTTADNKTIEIKPNFRVPRTYAKFALLMTELLLRGKLTTTKCIRVVPGPVQRYLPTNGQKVSLSISGQPVNLRTWVDDLDPGMLAQTPMTFVIGGVAQGDPTNDLWDEGWLTDMISISSFALTASSVCQKIVDEFEYKWNIL